MNNKISVYRKAKFVVVSIGEPKRDDFFNNDFRDITFVEVGTSKIFPSVLLDMHYERLQKKLERGNIVELDYDVNTNWIRSIDRKRWN
ncbi:hypothetical protein CQ476_22 [TM7 phage DolZOral124_53_65]|nr:hypothetical protein CQ476_22 [TM7 phage DolZOral124_53_65]